MGDAAASAAGRLCEALATRGWGVDADFIAPELVGRLRARLRALEGAGAFRAAAVGAGAHRAVRPSIRGDRLCWIGPTTTTDEDAFLARMEALRGALNRELKLGLFDFECQYAIYAPGARYARHLDRSPAGAERVVSVVAYLNETWAAADGGELCVFTDSGGVSVLPNGGTLVLFESARFEHEVRAAQRERLSVAGWFRRRAHLPA